MFEANAIILRPIDELRASDRQLVLQLVLAVVIVLELGIWCLAAGAWRRVTLLSSFASIHLVRSGFGDQSSAACFVNIPSICAFFLNPMDQRFRSDGKACSALPRATTRTQPS
jgi:hypothetical protein